MITRIRFGGVPLPRRKVKLVEVARLLEIDPMGTSKFRIRLSDLRTGGDECEDFAAEFGDRNELMFRRLFVYFVASCFFPDSISTIAYNFVMLTKHRERLGTYDWGSATFAAFLEGMRKKSTGAVGSFSGFYLFLQVLFCSFEAISLSVMFILMFISCFLSGSNTHSIFCYRCRLLSVFLPSVP